MWDPQTTRNFAGGLTAGGLIFAAAFVSNPIGWAVLAIAGAAVAIDAIGESAFNASWMRALTGNSFGGWMTDWFTGGVQRPQTNARTGVQARGPQGPMARQAADEDQDAGPLPQVPGVPRVAAPQEPDQRRGPAEIRRQPLPPPPLAAAPAN